MIYEIKCNYKNKDYVIDLQNKVARELYGIDSVNLLLGNNGSGKTTILKNVITALSKKIAEKNVDIYKSKGKLGVVYFTPSPFHRKISVRSNSEIRFIDASGQSAKLWRNDPAQFLKDVQKVFFDFSIESSLMGRSEFNLVDIAFEVLYKIFNDVRKKKYYSDGYGGNYIEELEGEYSRYFAMESDYLKLKSDVQKMESDRFGVRIKTEEDSNLKWKKDLYNAQGIELRRFERSIKRIISDLIMEEFRHWSPGDLFGRQGVMHVPALLAIAIHKKIPSEKMYRILLDYKKETREVSEIEDFIRHWVRNNLLGIECKGGVLSLNFNLMHAYDVLKYPGFQMYVELGLINVGFENLSSGESAILEQCLSLRSAGRYLVNDDIDSLVFIIDEGDMLLHLTWQRAYIEKICKVLASFADGRRVQLIVATHSPLLASDVVSSAITCLNDQEDKILGFGAPMSSIFSYDFDAPPVGCIAEAWITKLAEREGNYSDTDRNIISLIDDEMIKGYLEDLDVVRMSYDS